GERFALDVSTAVTLEEAPVRIEAPHEAVPLARLQLVLARRTCVDDLGHTRASDRTVSPIRRGGYEQRLVLRIQRRGNDLLHVKAQEDAEAIARLLRRFRVSRRVFEYLRLDNVRTEDRGVPIVVL